MVSKATITSIISTFLIGHHTMSKMILVSNHCAQLVLVNNSLFGNKAKESGTLDCYSSSVVKNDAGFTLVHSSVILN